MRARSSGWRRGGASMLKCKGLRAQVYLVSSGDGFAVEDGLGEMAGGVEAVEAGGAAGG